MRHLHHVTWTFEQTVVPLFLWKIHIKFGFNRPSGCSGKEVSKCWIWVTLVQGQWMTLTFIQVLVLIELTASTNYYIIDYNNFWKIHCFTFSQYKSIRDQIWPCRKIGQGQPRVIIWINLVVLEHPMLHIKFLGHRPFGSREEDFFKVFAIYGHGGHLGYVTRTVWTIFRFPSRRRLHMEFGFNRPSGYLYYNLTMSLKAQVS